MKAQREFLSHADVLVNISGWVGLELNEISAKELEERQTPLKFRIKALPEEFETIPIIHLLLRARNKTETNIQGSPLTRHVMIEKYSELRNCFSLFL